MQEFRYMIAGRMYSIWEVDEAVLRAGLPPPENGSNLFSFCFTLKAWDRLSLLQLMIHVYNVLLTGRTPVYPMQHLYALLYSMLPALFFTLLVKPCCVGFPECYCARAAYHCHENICCFICYNFTQHKTGFCFFPCLFTLIGVFSKIFPVVFQRFS